MIQWLKYFYDPGLTDFGHVIVVINWITINRYFILDMQVISNDNKIIDLDIYH